MYKSKSNKIGIIITIIILIVLVFLSNLKVNRFSLVDNLCSDLIMPIQSGITYLKNKLSKNDNYFTTMNNLKEENKKLKETNSNLEMKLRELEVIQAENLTMKEFLNLTNQYSNFDTVPAYIINKDISNYSCIFVINVGRNNGIEENMTVIASEGLVGHVISVTDKTAKVQTLIDTSNVASGVLENSKDTIICRGTLTNNELKASYISTDTVVTEGEKVFTSGMGGIYSKGIYIGKIKKVNQSKNITDKNCILETAVDFKNLETVLVITN